MKRTSIRFHTKHLNQIISQSWGINLTNLKKLLKFIKLEISQLPMKISLLPWKNSILQTWSCQNHKETNFSKDFPIKAEFLVLRSFWERLQPIFINKSMKRKKKQVLKIIWNLLSRIRQKKLNPRRLNLT